MKRSTRADIVYSVFISSLLVMTVGLATYLVVYSVVNDPEKEIELRNELIHKQSNRLQEEVQYIETEFDCISYE
jgi:hypothetical protein